MTDNNNNNKNYTEMIKIKNKFINDFKNKFGVSLTVIINNFNSNQTKALSLKDIEKIINRYKSESLPSIKDSSRKKELHLLRMCFSKLASEEGYDEIMIGDYLNRDRSTINNQKTALNDLLSVNDKRAKYAWDNIKYDYTMHLLNNKS